MKKAIGMNQNTVDAASKDQIISYLQHSLMEAVFQLNAVNEVGQEAKD